MNQDRKQTGTSGEFSLPGGEFSQPRQEYSLFREGTSHMTGEFSPPKEEIHAAGGEHFQTAKPAEKQKKKRRISPLMVTAAAVSSSVVIVSGISLSGGHDTPSVRLRPEEAAVLEEVKEALRTEDVEALLQAAEDPVMYSLLTETVADYYRQDHFADDDHGVGDPVIHETETEIYTDINGDFSFNGTEISAVWLFHETGDEMWISLHYVTDKATGVRRLASVYADWAQEQDIRDMEIRYPMRIMSLSLNAQRTITQWMTQTALCGNAEITTEPNYQRNIPVQVTRREYWNDSAGGITLTETVGDCVWESVRNGDPEDYDGEVMVSYVENGTFTRRRDTGSGWEELEVIEIRDGYTIRNGERDRYHEYQAYN